ncbi:MAG: flagellar biosynthesis repressor FlbT [Pseudomonadota bacterium]
MALKLELKPGEKLVVNGAVLCNGDRRATFSVENTANILREADVMTPSQATTPAKRIYLPIMMMMLEADGGRAHFAEFEQRLQEFAGAVTDIDALKLCATIAARVSNGRHHQALSLCKKLIAFEAERLAHVA